MRIKLITSFVLIVFFLAGALGASTISYHVDTTIKNDSSVRLSDVIRTNSVLLQILTNEESTCRYSNVGGRSYVNMEEVFDINYETLHKKTLFDLIDGIYRYYIRCKDVDGEESGELEAIFRVDIPVSAQIILSEGPPVKAGMIEVMLITSKAVSQTPSLSYSFDGVSYSPIPLFGSETIWQGYLIISDSSDEKVGSFKFQARDLEGTIGSEITSGSVFLVDNKIPETIIDINAIGYEGRIELSWYINEEIDKFDIYRSISPNVDYADFYKSTTSDSYSDTSVEKGKTYYYRVNGIDDAGNEGGLSSEVYATALLKNSSVIESGLDIRFLGVVDNFISEIDSIINNAEDVKFRLKENNELESEIYLDLKLEREVDNANTELASLKREVEGIRSQSLTQTELDKRLQSSRLRLNTIKRKIPNNVVVVDERKDAKEISEDELREIILELNPEILESDLGKKVEKTLKFIEESGFNVKIEAYNVEIIYLNGDTKDVVLVKEKINPDLGNNESISIIEVISKEVEGDIINIDIKNNNYDVIKADPIVSFSSETKEIIYSMDRHIDLGLINKIKTFPLLETQEEISNGFTGYFTFVDFGEGRSYLGVGIGLLIVLGLVIYLFIMKRNMKVSENIEPIKKAIEEINEDMKKKKFENVKTDYQEICKLYKELEKSEKIVVYSDLEKIQKKILES